MYRFSSEAQASTAQTNKRHAALTSTYANVLDTHGTLTARALKGAHAAPLTRRAQRVAFVIGIALSIAIAPSSYGSIDATKSIKKLANYQLTDKQYKCHNEIIYRESRWNYKAVGNIGGTKQAYGLYQLKIDSLHNAHPELQFWKYWQYVNHRYGITEYDEPDYCAALNHLIRRGWQ
jgi:hypothetical protein